MIDAHVWMAKQDKKAREAKSSELSTTARRCAKAELPIDKVA
jgi:hypothetical protein